MSEVTLDHDSHVVVLSITRVPWKSTFHSMTLDFGKSDDEFVLRRHKPLIPRQAAATSTAAAASSIAYPAAPSSTPSNFNASAHFNPHWLDTSILPPDPSLGKLSVSGPKMLVETPQQEALTRFLSNSQSDHQLGSTSSAKIALSKETSNSSQDHCQWEESIMRIPTRPKAL